MTTTSRTRTRGMSIAELLVGMSLSLVALAALYSAFMGQERALAAQETYAETQVVTRSVTDLMLRELRMAAYDPTGAALPKSPGPDCPGVAQGIAEATSSRVRFRQDLNGDGVLTGAAEDVAYELASGELRRIDQAAGTVVLASGFGSATFRLRYFNGSNPPVELVPAGNPAALTAGQRDCVVKVQVTLDAISANPNPRNPTPLHSQAASQVAIRSRALGNF